MTYHAPVLESFFFLEHCTSLKRLAESNPDLSPDLVKSVLEEAGKFADGVLAPLNRVGDQEGTLFENGVVRTPKGWKEAYRAWAEAGWNGLGAPVEYGGQGLPTLVNMACLEFWSSACMAWGLGPILTIAAIEALQAHASEELKKKYLARLVSGEWTGSMQLTEPQAGSDLATLRTRAMRANDGSYRLKGTKIFISYGEHDMTDNIIHLVLARLPDAPPGTKGISLFLVPKFLVKDDGSLGARNDVRASGVEHKLGMHASPTCTMVFGDNGGAVGYLVGEENRGLACMFTMMNQARLAVGIQGVAIAERAMQQAFAFARERKQGAAPGANGRGPIIEHPDVKRMLLTMRALTSASRAISYKCADAIDRAKHSADKTERAAAQEEANMLTPDRQGVLDRHRHRGRVHRRAGAWRHGFHRGNRRRAALSRRAHRRDLRGHQRHSVDRPRHPQNQSIGRRDAQADDRGLPRDGRTSEETERSRLRRDCAQDGGRNRRARRRLAISSGGARQEFGRDIRGRDPLSAPVRPRRGCRLSRRSRTRVERSRSSGRS